MLAPQVNFGCSALTWGAPGLLPHANDVELGHEDQWQYHPAADSRIAVAASWQSDLKVSEDSSRKVIRPTEESVRARLAETGISLPEELAPGTVANLIVLQDHMLTVRGFVLDDYRRVAMHFEP